MASQQFRGNFVGSYRTTEVFQASRKMIELIQLGSAIQDFMEERQWRFCFIGGLALMRWGEPRFTQDIDLTLLTGFKREDEYVTELLKEFSPRVKDVESFASKNRVVLLRSAEGIGIDIALGGLTFEERAVERSSKFEYEEGFSLRTCSAEDLLVMKAFAARDQDWVDVAGIVTRQGDKLNWSRIWDELKPLVELKGSPEILTRLKSVQRQVRE
jgi:hypothetical protein